MTLTLMASSVLLLLFAFLLRTAAVSAGSSSDEAEASGIEEDDSDDEEEEAGLPCREPWAGISAKTLRGILRQCHWEATRLAMQDDALKELGPIGHFRNPPAPVKGMALSRKVEGSIFEKLEKE